MKTTHEKIYGGLKGLKENKFLSLFKNERGLKFCDIYIVYKNDNYYYDAN